MPPDDAAADARRPATFLTDLVCAGTLPAPASGTVTEARLEAALRRLRPAYREVICLRAYCGMSDQRIATAMDLPSAGTAQVLLLRALTELRARL